MIKKQSIVYRFLFILVWLLFSQCNFTTESNEATEKTFKAIVDTSKKFNPLDTILGDKILNEQTGSIRQNNFKSLIGMNEAVLRDSSNLYSVQKLNTNHYLLKQKHRYSEARLFNLILTSHGGEISNYVSFDDFEIVDIKKDSDNWIILLSDFNYNENRYWKSEQQLKIIKADKSFKAIWTYLRKSDRYPIEPRAIVIQKKNYLFKLELITGCHMCVNFVDLILSRTGVFGSATSTHKQYTEKLIDSAELHEIFR